MRVPAAYMRFLFPLVLVLCAQIECGSLNAQTPPRITGTYTNMYYNDEGGDVLGYELKIVYIGTDFQGALQIAEGVPGPLILVEIHMSGSKISFSIPDGTQHAGEFNGTVERGILKGEFRFKSGGFDKVVLPRRKSYWD